ncbi:M15 family metallopeptidase [Amycolatopsis thermophila]|uniref:Peptidase M15C domain-containing protein n=1 Tax=Amycolatopsis thermophila TaxID=206084 RepID=A0ABU0EN46_9PSEU|nr:M15 family metallopeptidase [Amycolatopsis thermophila]MDQ0376478.1 hypothetical protein [Amycolatopsis thermophila]
MATSQNGYSANDINATESALIPGTSIKVRLRKGPAGQLLRWVASQFDKRVEDIDPGQLDDWGYAERTIRGSSTELSNHASGTAIDLNATRHPLGTNPSANFSAAQIRTIREIVALTEGCVRWGGDYVGRKDPMHFEIVRGEADCARVLAKLTNGSYDEGDDMFEPTDRNRMIWQEQALRTIINQLTGDPEGDPSFNAQMKWQGGNFPGWRIDLGNGQSVNLSLVDMLRQVFTALLGYQKSRIAGDNNITKVVDLAFDQAKWEFEDKAAIRELRDKLDQVLAKLDDAPTAA